MNFNRDKKIKLDYNPVLYSELDYQNAVGATDSLTLRTLDFTPSDTNTIYVAKSGNDTTAAGTAADPVLTIEHADSLLTATKTYIVIMDSGEYKENSHSFSANFKGVFAAIGQMPTIKPILIAASNNYLIETVKDKTIISDNLRSLSGGSESLLAYSKCASLTNGNFVVIFNSQSSTSFLGYIYFIIIDKDGNVIKSQTLLSNLDYWHGYGDVCALDSGHFVIATSGQESDGDYTGRFYIYDNSGNAITNVLVANPAYSGCTVSSVGGYEDRFVIVFINASGMQYIIASADGTLIKSLTSLTSFYTDYVYTQVIPHPTDGFIVFGKAYSSVSNIWCVVDNSNAVLKNSAVLSGTGWCSGYTEDGFITFACGDSSNNLHLIQYDLSDYSVSKSDTIVTTLADASHIVIEKLLLGSFAVSAGFSSGSFNVISKDWALIYSESLSNLNGIDLTYNTLTDRLMIFYPSSTSPYKVTIYIKSGFIADWWVTSSDVNFNGITFDNDEDYIHRYLYSSSGTIKFKWCELLNIARDSYHDSDKYPLFAIEAVVTAAEFSNCKVFNNNAGFKITSNSVLVQHCQFFKQLLNPAIYIIGAGSGIIINHNDFLYNYICVDLEDNDGSEIIKNNIFFYSLPFSIQAETEVTYTNSIETAESYNATAGAQVICSNPHYVNDGYISLDAMNLILKSRELGYKFDSPALLIGDDLKNAGSLEYDVSGGTQTWTTISTVKPKITKGYSPVGAVETSYKDGSVESYRDSYTEVLKLEWESLLETDFLNLMQLYFNSSNVVRIFLDPISEPGSYGTYVLIYDKVTASPEYWEFDDIGKNDFSLTFKRAYNEGV